MHNREKVWRTADGRSIAIKDMQLGHLVNVINWITDNRDAYAPSILDTMVAEAKYRQTFLFAEGSAYPQKVGHGWKIIDPQTGVGKIEKPPADYIENVKDNAAYQHMSKRTREKRRQSNT
jgi:hypothetical protein